MSLTIPESSQADDEPGRVGADVLAVEPDLPPVDLIVTPPAVRERAGLRRRSALPAVLASDIVALGMAVFAGSAVDQWLRGQPALPAALHAVPYLAVFVPLLSAYGLYRRARRRLVASTFPDLSQLAHALLVGALLVVIGSRGLHRTLGLSPVPADGAALAGVCALVLIPVCRVVTRSVLRSGHGARRVLVVGSGHVAAVALQRLSATGMDIVGCVDDEFPDGSAADPRLLGRLDDLPAIVREHDVDQIVVAFSPATGAKLANQLRSLADDVQISVVPRLFDLLTVRSHVDDLHGLPVVDVAPAALGPADRFLKRAMDIALASLAIVATLPLTVAVAVAVKLGSPGPVLFRQQRSGRNGHPFRINKFRTMTAEAESQRSQLEAANEVDGPLFKLRTDPRTTRVGALLRRTSLDEIPQLWNVLIGEMSLVGPRPFVTAESAEIGGWAARRFDVRPGLTGLWQISGRNNLPFEELCRLDYSYVASWSLWWDLRILWHTPGAVLARRGAY